eukprot:1055390-Pyramimonas_sp.AAC.1
MRADSPWTSGHAAKRKLVGHRRGRRPERDCALVSLYLPSYQSRSDFWTRLISVVEHNPSRCDEGTSMQASCLLFSSVDPTTASLAKRTNNVAPALPSEAH